MPKKRGIRFSGKALELGRKYMWRKESVPLLYKYLDIHPGQKVVDVGCGTGFMTRLVARALKGKGKVIGVDRNPQLIRFARKAASEAGLESLVSFRQSDARKLDLGDNLADRVFCQAVLWAIPDPKKAIREMIRICKPGGLIGAIEGGFDSVLFYYPHSERLSELANKEVRAYAAGQRKLDGLDRGIGIRLPSLFQELGLKRTRLDAYVYTWLQRDDRIPLDHKVRLYRLELKELEHPSERIRESLIVGGMTSEEIDEHDRLYLKYVKKVIKDPDFSEEDTSVNAGIFFITTGIK